MPRKLWKKPTPLEIVLVSSATTPVELVTAACEQAKAAVAPALVNFTWRSVEEAIAVLRSRHTFYPPAPWHDHRVLYNEFLCWRLVRVAMQEPVSTA